MKQKGSFTDDVIIFTSKAAFDQYAQTYSRSIERLEGQELDAALYDVGAYYDAAAGEAIDYESGETIYRQLNNGDFGDKDPEAEIFRLTKGLLIADQMKIKRNIEILETETAKLNYISMQKDFTLTKNGV